MTREELYSTLNKYDQIREKVVHILKKLRFIWAMDITDISDIRELTKREMWNIKDAYPCRILVVRYDDGDGYDYEYIPEDWLFYTEEELEQAVSKEKDRRVNEERLYELQRTTELAQQLADKERAEYERLKKKFEGSNEV